MAESFAMFTKNPLSVRVVGSGKFVGEFLCNLERKFQEAQDEMVESIRQDLEHDND